MLHINLVFRLDCFKQSSLTRVMRRSDRKFLDVIFPKVRSEILRLLFGGLKRRRCVRELARETGLALCTVQDELRKLRAVDLVRDYSNGYHRYYAPNASHPVFREIRRIVEIEERLPRVAQSALRRPRFGRKRRRTSRRVRARSMPPNRPPSWGIFKYRPKS